MTYVYVVLSRRNEPHSIYKNIEDARTFVKHSNEVCKYDQQWQIIPYLLR
jgi:hypothetical protein